MLANPLTMNDDYSRHRNSITCYQLALAERVGQCERCIMCMARSSAFLCKRA